MITYDDFVDLKNKIEQAKNTPNSDSRSIQLTDVYTLNWVPTTGVVHVLHYGIVKFDTDQLVELKKIIYLLDEYY